MHNILFIVYASNILHQNFPQFILKHFIHESIPSIAIANFSSTDPQVTEDQRLLRERVHHLSGNAGIERMESALYDTRMKYFQARETGGNPVGSPISLISAPPAVLPAAAYPSKANERSDLIKETHKSSHVARKLFGGEANPGEVGYSSQGHPSGKRVELENELIVNESLHGELLVLDNSPESTSEHQNKIKVSELPW